MPGPGKQGERQEEHSPAGDSRGDTETGGMVFHLLHVAPRVPWGSQKAFLEERSLFPLGTKGLVTPSLGPVPRARAEACKA